ncbi:MAG TPA: rhomboid family intramembrane serine protease [Candidatus Aquilonibacter sp.]|nr:rhomboid family intramembrane serine protease [Candidatus Aquilonibacter sp.]
MLEDRDYMRQPVYHEPRVSFTIALLIVNAAVFLVQLVAWHTPNGADIQDKYFALSLDGLKSGYIWQLLTFQFMHAGWMHILFNSLAIFFFGRPVENFFGRGKFLALYFSSGVIGGLVQMLFALLFPSFDGAVVGASAGAVGLLAAFAALYWAERFTLFFYFIPISMRGRTLFWASLALVAAGMLTPYSHIANAAHLGGILTGFLCARLMLHGRWPQWKLPSRRSEPREFAAAGNNKKSFWRSSAAAKPDEDLSADEFLQREVDPILDKISAHGIQSLTAREREILENARSKMGKR